MPKKSNSRIILYLLRKRKNLIYLSFILISALYLRTFNLNWDNNYYFHPDERAIVMFVIPLSLPSTFPEFLNPQSSLNPHFFAYGNMPLYLLKAAGEISSTLNPIYRQYGGIHIPGRLISAFFDTGTVVFVFLLGIKLFTRRTGLFAALLYSLSVFPIQLSHYFAVDTLLTFFVTGVLFLSLKYFKNPSLKMGIFLGIFFGLSLATKISALILLPLIVFILIYSSILKRSKNMIIPFLARLVTIIISTLLVFFLTQPYVAIDFQEFIKQTTLQARMGRDPFVFPYTLQYVGKVPYVYELNNIFLFGQGPIISLICFTGIFIAIYRFAKKWKKNILILFMLFYVFFYFAIVGKFAVGWMRYMLPIYPIFSIFGGFLISEMLINKIPKNYLSNVIIKKSLLVFFVILLLIYPVSYQSIYKKPNTRIQASDWINNNIPVGKTIAVEHWDDALPVYGTQNYIHLTLPLYEPDTNEKWIKINETLSRTDYIIIASNRLYVPLQKLIDCKTLPPERCYPRTAKYYEDLFSQKLGFRKVAEFTQYPTIPILNIKLNDQGADESFTVYDHPKVMIYGKK